MESEYLDVRGRDRPTVADAIDLGFVSAEGVCDA